MEAIARAPETEGRAGGLLEEIRTRVVRSPTEGRTFRDRHDPGLGPGDRALTDVGRVAGKPELFVLRTPEGRVSLIGSHWLEPADHPDDTREPEEVL